MPTLPVPDHFDETRVGEIYRVPYEERARQAEAFRTAHGITKASTDGFRVGLLIVDAQNTFCIPGYELFVAGRSGVGAVEDNARLCRFIYRNLGRITRIHATLDTHRALQIFHAAFLLNESGRHPDPMTVVSLEDVEAGRVRLDPEAALQLGEDPERLQRHLLHYCRELTRRGKYELMVWPYHAMLGGIGHALVPAVEEALFFHNMARASQTAFEIKGDNALSENYSALQPEVLSGADGQALASMNRRLVEELLSYDALLVAGQAKSHCVAWTVSDLLSEIRKRDESLAHRIFLLDDCSSPVVVSGVADFTEQAESQYREFAESGMNVVRSTEPLERFIGVARA